MGRVRRSLVGAAWASGLLAVACAVAGPAAAHSSGDPGTPEDYQRVTVPAVVCEDPRPGSSTTNPAFPIDVGVGERFVIIWIMDANGSSTNRLMGKLRPNGRVTIEGTEPDGDAVRVTGRTRDGQMEGVWTSTSPDGVVCAPTFSTATGGAAPGAATSDPSADQPVTIEPLDPAPPSASTDDGGGSGVPFVPIVGGLLVLAGVGYAAARKLTRTPPPEDRTSWSSAEGPVAVSAPHLPDTNLPPRAAAAVTAPEADAAEDDAAATDASGEEPPETPPEPQPVLRPGRVDAGTLRGVVRGSLTGQAALDYVAAQGITIEYIEHGDSRWDAANNRIVIDAADLDDFVLSLVHEVNHAQADAATRAAWECGTREEFVGTMIEQEAEGTVRAIRANLELSASGRPVPRPSTLQPQYEDAYRRAVEEHRSAHPEATAEDLARVGDAAGYARVRAELVDGGSTFADTADGITTYANYYGKAWDAAHPHPGGG